MPTLLRDEAAARNRLLQVQNCDVELDLTGDDETFASRSLIRFAATRPGADTFVDFKGVCLHEVALNGRRLDPESWSDGRLPLRDLAAENELMVAGVMAYSHDGEGLQRSIDPADGRTYLYAMSFLDAAPRWFACFDQPDLKSRYTMRVRTPPGWTVLGNARFDETSPGSWEMTESEPLATYFVTLVAGPYASVADEHDGIRLGLHARASLAHELSHQADDILEVTKQCLDAYHHLFQQRYPFGDYHQCFVPDFNAAAMENPGCVTFRDQFLFRGASTAAERAQRAGTIAHEMAHQWFGDLVTMQWWDDLWLNESFAEYLGHRVCSAHTRHGLWLEFSMNRKDWGMIADQGPSTHPVAGNGAADSQSALAQFDGISYAKGAALLRQLAAYLGDECFFAGLRGFFVRHRFANAAFADLVTAWDEAGAVDLERWCEAWLLTQGMDTLQVAHGSGTVAVEVVRDQTDHVRPHVVTVGCFDSAGTELSARPVTVGTEKLHLPCEGEFAVPDINDMTWARIRTGVHPTRWPSVSRIVSGATRAVLWNSLRDSVRSAEVDPALALRMICDQIPAEDEVVIVSALLGYAHHDLSGPYSPPRDRSARIRRVAETAAKIWGASDPESDVHLVALRTFLASTDDVELLRKWLVGQQPPRGMDPELRWTAVCRLANLTGDRAVIEDAFDRDTSASGRVHRAKALASVPETEAKEEAFDLLMSPSKISSYELYATAEGFFVPEQAELTEPFVKRFFEQINDTAEFRSGWALSRLAMSAFPAAATTRSSLELAEKTLEDNKLHPSIRRVLIDATDRLRRAVIAVERYAGSTEMAGK